MGMMIRGFQDETDRIQINTDSRSRKVISSSFYLFWLNFAGPFFWGEGIKGLLLSGREENVNSGEIFFS